jgi:hypothetical protein
MDEDLDLGRRDHHEREHDRDHERERDRDRDRDRERDRERDHERDRDRDRRNHRDRDPNLYLDDDYLRDRKEGKLKEIAAPPEDDHDGKKDNIRDKVATGLGIAAASIGLKSAMKKPADERDKEDKLSPRRRDDEDNDRYRPDDTDGRSKASRKEPLLGDEDFEIIEHPKERGRSRKDAPAETEAEAWVRYENEAKTNSDAGTVPPRDQSSSGDSANPSVRRRRRASSAFNPNDTASLAALKAQLAAYEDKENTPKKEIPTVKEPSPERRLPPIDRRSPDGSSASMVLDDPRGRELMPPLRDDKQVRVVSPPKEKEEKKPIKGILKQPKPQFPEEPNPVREGVAPHKDDKTKVNVPNGARWTKISRKMVNPDALTIGKERFELRDDFVIVLRVLSKEEIQGYALATAQLRGMFLLSQVLSHASSFRTHQIEMLFTRLVPRASFLSLED